VLQPGQSPCGQAYQHQCPEAIFCDPPTPGRLSPLQQCRLLKISLSAGAGALSHGPGAAAFRRRSRSGAAFDRQHPIFFDRGAPSFKDRAWGLGATQPREGAAVSTATAPCTSCSKNGLPALRGSGPVCWSAPSETSLGRVSEPSARPNVAPRPSVTPQLGRRWPHPPPAARAGHVARPPDP